MKTRTISRILEGIFILAMILSIYILSIFSAKGQMPREIVSPFELALSSSSEPDFNQISRFDDNFQRFDSIKEFDYLPNYLKANDESKIINNISLPKLDLRKRRVKKYLAPSVRIPLN